MSLIKPSARLDVGAPRQHTYRSESELRLRAAVERWCRAKWPDARVCHELVVWRGLHRADVVAAGPSHLVAVEIKSDRDVADRLLGQVAAFRLAAPEVWICAAGQLRSDADLLAWLFPSLGVLTPDRDTVPGPEQFELIERRPAQLVPPYPEALLNLLWVEELLWETNRHRLVQGRPRLNHGKLVKLMLRLDPAEQLAAVCRQLRARQAQWRADPAVPLPNGWSP